MELFGPSFCISVLKSWTTQILRHSLDFTGFYMIKHYFSHILKISSNLRGVDLICWGEPILENVWIIGSHLLYFCFQKLNDPNFSSFIRFDWILHDSALLFSSFENSLKFKRGNLICWGGEPILQKGWIIWSSCCILVIKSWTTQILGNWLDLIGFYVIQHYFSHIVKISSNSKGGT